MLRIMGQAPDQKVLLSQLGAKLRPEARSFLRRQRIKLQQFLGEVRPKIEKVKSKMSMICDMYSAANKTKSGWQL